MNLNECRDLLKNSLFGKLPKAVQAQIPIDEFMNYSSKYITDANIPYENIKRSLIFWLKKYIIKSCNAGTPPNIQMFKRWIDKIVSENNLRVPLPVADKKIKNNSEMQRRLDSLSRVLSVSSSMSPCIAVVLVEGQLLITTNTPADPTKFQQAVKDKLNLLRYFLNKITPSPDLVLHDQDAIKFTRRGDLAAFKVADALMSSGTGVVSSEKYSREKRLKIDVMKIASSYLEGIGSQGKKGFNSKQIKSLLEANPIFYFPNSEKEAETGLFVHAEQKMLLELKRLSDQGKISSDEFPIIIGISKLACQACESVLDANPSYVCYRGASDVGFPRVVDVTTGKGHQTRPRITTETSMIPNDSDSDVSLEHCGTTQTKQMAGSSKPPEFYSVFKAPRLEERGVNQPPAIKLKS